jgi:uncharacterized protein
MKRLPLIVALVWTILMGAWLVLCTRPGYGVGPAFVLAAALELAFYIGFLHEEGQAWIQKLPRDRRIWLIVTTALLPYLVYAPATGQFDLANFLSMAAVITLAALFYRDGVSIERDLWFLALMAAVTLADANKFWFTGGDKRVPAAAMGQLMWIRTGLAVLLVVRSGHLPLPRLWPQPEGWRQGLKFGLLTCGVVFPLSLAIKFGELHSPDAMLRAIPGAMLTFFGIYWVVALSEEVFFRGLLMKALDTGLRSKTASLVATSLLFGAVHLPARQFPNWKFALLAAVAGWFYGLAARKSENLASAMVAHALVVAIWRVLY